MRILLFSTLYPNDAAPNHGVFVENRMRAYGETHKAEFKVIAPTPWFPVRHKIFGRYARWARAPYRERRHGVEIRHPRYFLLPKIGMRFAPRALARVLEQSARMLIAEGWDFDFIDAHYFFPDGVAGEMAAKRLGKPLAITARGSDVTTITNHPWARKKIVQAALSADAVIAVAPSLKKALCQIGTPAQKISVLRNGVDLDHFRPSDRYKIRKKMALNGPVIASVGHLIERKGHDIAIDALRAIDDATLLIAGGGPLRKKLMARADNAGVSARVRFLGTLPHESLREVYEAADILVLASAREGWPNVLLEALACGTPCIASDVGAAREIIAAPVAGRVVASRTHSAFADAIKDMLARPIDRAGARAYAQRFCWKETTDRMNAIFVDLSNRTQRRKCAKIGPAHDAIAYTRPKLLVTIDAEERFDWSNLDNPQIDKADINALKRIQALCQAHAIKPIYFLTYPLLADASLAANIKKWRAAGEADFGLHLHSWATPPATDFSGSYYSFQTNLPSEIYQQKLRALADQFRSVFGERAQVHRAGRYGVRPEDYALLCSIGVEFDFSPSPGFCFADEGGPDFRRMSNAPFLIETGGHNLTIIPVSGARAIKGTAYFLPAKGAAPGFARPATSWIDHFLAPARLTPEGTSLGVLKALTRRLIADEAPLLTFTFHSTSLTPGANPYCRDENDADELIERCNAYFNWFRTEICSDIVTLNDLRAE